MKTRIVTLISVELLNFKFIFFLLQMLNYIEKLFIEKLFFINPMCPNICNVLVQHNWLPHSRVIINEKPVRIGTKILITKDQKYLFILQHSFINLLLLDFFNN